jgi:plasmid stabilization system protein ParE
MAELVYAAHALADLERLSDFLRESDPAAAQDTVALIFQALEILEQHPEIGRKVPFGQRELVISRGKTGYLALYRFLPHTDRVLVLAVRHQRESGYRTEH